jgi:hypothetical protein
VAHQKKNSGTEILQLIIGKKMNDSNGCNVLAKCYTTGSLLLRKDVDMIHSDFHSQPMLRSCFHTIYRYNDVYIMVF